MRIIKTILNFVSLCIAPEKNTDAGNSNFKLSAGLDKIYQEEPSYGLFADQRSISQKMAEGEYGNPFHLD